MKDDVDTKTKPRTRTRRQVARPPLFKVILVNDDFTPREFVVRVLKAEFRMTEDQAHRVPLVSPIPVAEACPSATVRPRVGRAPTAGRPGKSTVVMGNPFFFAAAGR